MRKRSLVFGGGFETVLVGEGWGAMIHVFHWGCEIGGAGRSGCWGFLVDEVVLIIHRETFEVGIKF